MASPSSHQHTTTTLLRRAVLVTGASGLLGRAVTAAFSAAGWTTTGVGFTRAQPPHILQCDLRDPAAVQALVQETLPSLVIHAAAERRPDVCEGASEESERINIDAVYHLARACAKAKAGFVLIGTDYLFDGTSAPYKEDSPTCPLNAYGAQKARAEHAALAAHPSAVVLRVPVLYGPSEDVKESAVTVFADVALNSGKPASVDDWQVRVPTYTPDIARTLVRMGEAMIGGGGGGGGASSSSSSSPSPPPKLPGGIYHYSSAEKFTRYGFVKLFGGMLRCPIDHVTRTEGPPPGAPRPYDCFLLDTKLGKLGLAAEPTPFEEGMRSVVEGLQRAGKLGGAGGGGAR